MHDINIKWRTWWKGIPPRPIKLEIPGWAGGKNWDVGQPWHCKPFKDASTYGLELLYPFDTEVTVTTKNGELIFTGDFSEEKQLLEQSWERPFSSFAPHHFGFTSSLDIQTEPGWGTMILPHPRYYTDRTGTVPLAIGGFIESDFWPRVFFVVFKSPLEGQTYVFRKHEGYAKVLFLPKSVKYNISQMTVQEAKQRQELEQILSDYASKISTNTWKTINHDSFDNKYKILSGIAKQKGVPAVSNHLESIKLQESDNKKSKQEQARRKFPRKIFRNVNN